MVVTESRNTSLEISAAAAEEQPSKLPQVALVARHVDRPWQVRGSTWQSQ